MKKHEKKENVEKIKALFLNKVKGLEWHYFDIDLNSTIVSIKKDDFAKKQDFDKFLNKIKKDYNTYIYTENRDDIDVKTIVSSLLAYIKDEPNILKHIIARIFDVNEENIQNKSESDQGTIGKFNQKDKERRNKKYHKLIKKGHRAKKENIVIMAEGDSWFEFPRLKLKDPVKDIIDQLIKYKKYAVYSLAAGGDWLSNMMYKKEYISELPRISPDVFLISGGGNDMVGSNRLAAMVINPLLQDYFDVNSPKQYEKLVLKRINDFKNKKLDEEVYKNKYKRGLKYINEEFLLFIDVCMIQYFLFFMDFKDDKNNNKRYNKMIFITQGYDYAIPSIKNNGFVISLQRLMNKVMKTGKWLSIPLGMKGITDKQIQEDIVFTMLHEFNEMLIQLAEFKHFPNVFHIDCRGTAESKNDWFDELHLKSKGFKKIAKAYDTCIIDNLRMNENRSSKKVYKVYSN